jgi:hypothetical protein
MRCALCVKANKRHKVLEEDRLVDRQAKPQRYFDEDDREHLHDPGSDLVYFRCSEGHAFTEATPAKPCPAEGCGFAERHQKTIDAAMLKRRAAKA